MSLDDWNDGWVEGQRDMLAKCIDAVNSYSNETHKHLGDLFSQCRHEYGDRCDITAALRVVVDQLRALQEKP